MNGLQHAQRALARRAFRISAQCVRQLRVGRQRGKQKEQLRVCGAHAIPQEAEALRDAQIVTRQHLLDGAQLVLWEEGKARSQSEEK